MMMHRASGWEQRQLSTGRLELQPGVRREPGGPDSASADRSGTKCEGAWSVSNDARLPLCIPGRAMWEHADHTCQLRPVRRCRTRWSALRHACGVAGAGRKAARQHARDCAGTRVWGQDTGSGPRQDGTPSAIPCWGRWDGLGRRKLVLLLMLISGNAAPAPRGPGNEAGPACQHCASGTINDAPLPHYQALSLRAGPRTLKGDNGGRAGTPQSPPVPLCAFEPPQSAPSRGSLCGPFSGAEPGAAGCLATQKCDLN